MLMLIASVAMTVIQPATGQTGAVSNRTISHSITTLMPPVTAVVEVEALRPLLPESIESNGTLSIITDSDLFGSTVKLRQSKGIIGDSFTIIIDTKNALLAGQLEYFYLFLEQNVQNNRTLEPSYLWLQIWRQAASGEDGHYQLVWRRLVYLNDSSPQALYVFNVSDDNFHVLSGDFIGWTAEDNLRFVSRDDDVSTPPCRSCTRSRFQHYIPIVRQEPYRDITLAPRQFVFSAAVKIKQPLLTRISSTSSPPSSSRVVSSSLGPVTVLARLSTISGTQTTGLSTMLANRLITSTDHTVAITLAVIFSLIGAVGSITVAVIIWKKRKECTAGAVWSALKMDTQKRDSRIELLESDLSSPRSSQCGFDDDSCSVTTSTSSEATAAANAAVARELRAPSPSVTGARPKYQQTVGPPISHATDRSGSNITTSSPNCRRYDPSARDNNGFVDDEAVASLHDRRPQQQKPMTHCVSVELHNTPREFDERNCRDESI